MARDRPVTRALRHPRSGPRGRFLTELRRRSPVGLLELGQNRQQPGRVGQCGPRATGELAIDENELGADRFLEEPGRSHTYPPLLTSRRQRVPPTGSLDFCCAAVRVATSFSDPEELGLGGGPPQLLLRIPPAGRSGGVNPTV